MICSRHSYSLQLTFGCSSLLCPRVTLSLETVLASLDLSPTQLGVEGRGRGGDWFPADAWWGFLWWAATGRRWDTKSAAWIRSHIGRIWLYRSYLAPLIPCGYSLFLGTRLVSASFVELCEGVCVLLAIASSSCLVTSVRYIKACCASWYPWNEVMSGVIHCRFKRWLEY